MMQELLNRLFRGHYKEDVIYPVNSVNADIFMLHRCGKTYADPRYQDINIGSQVNRIMYVISGTGVITIDKKIFIVKPGDTYLLHQYQDYNLYSDCINPMETIWFEFTGSFSESMIKVFKLTKSSLFKNLDISNYINEIQYLIQINENVQKNNNDLMVKFLELIQFLSVSKETIDLKNLSFTKGVKAYIDTHLLENNPVKFLASFYNRSVDHVRREFKKEYGLPPKQYAIQEKVKLGAAILTSTHQPYRILLEMLNISEDDAFKKHFIDTYGLMPTEYHMKKVQEAIDKMPVEKPQFPLY